MSRVWIRRYSDGDRMNHWIVVVLFFAAALSGFAFYHPALFWLSTLFGGGQWTRILHPFLGVVMFAAFVGMMMRFWHHNRMNAGDRQWLRQWRDVVENHEERLPEVGRYNAGQKLVFWITVVCLILLFVTGFFFWQPYFAPFVPVTLARIAVVVHAASATVVIIAIIVHIYAGIWVKGSVGAMTRGFVSERWARKHHPAWHREVTREP